MLFKILLSFLCLLFNGIDTYLTILILNGGGVELNPIMRSKYWIPIKLAASCILVIAGWILHWMVLIIPCILFAGACVWNTYVIVKGSK